MNRLDVKQSSIIAIPTPLGDFQLTFDTENNTCVVQLPKDIKFAIIGNIDLKVSGDLNAETSGEINLLSHNNMICLDSLDSSIHFNSLMAKQIRDLPEISSKREICFSSPPPLDEDKLKLNPLEKLMSGMCDLVRRITVLEEREKGVINLDTIKKRIDSHHCCNTSETD